LTSPGGGEFAANKALFLLERNDGSHRSSTNKGETTTDPFRNNLFFLVRSLELAQQKIR
jgi:hypothetical protein